MTPTPHVEFTDKVWLIHLDKGLMVLSPAQMRYALLRGKSYRRWKAMATREPSHTDTPEET